jgi:hypothetical protein
MNLEDKGSSEGRKNVIFSVFVVKKLNIYWIGPSEGGGFVQVLKKPPPTRPNLYR